jgi:hypothetical protein
MALKQWERERGALGTELNDARCTVACLLEAKAWRHMGNDKVALRVCQRTLEPGRLEYRKDMLEFLNMIVDILFKDGQYAKVIGEVQRQPHRVRCEWILYRSDEFTDKSDRLRHAAVLSRRTDILVQLYEEAIGYWTGKDFVAASALRYELAVIYRQDARSTSMADYVLKNMVREIQEDPKLLKGGMIRNVFPTLVDILYENCTVAYSEADKKISVQRLEQMLDYFKSSSIIEPVMLATAMITLAKMQKDLPPNGLQRAMTQADQAFKLCLEDLEDSIGSNDAAAFQTLSIVLMFVNLKEDALIAASILFSEVRDYDDSPPHSHPNLMTAEGGSLLDEDFGPLNPEKVDDRPSFDGRPQVDRAESTWSFPEEESAPGKDMAHGETPKAPGDEAQAGNSINGGREAEPVPTTNGNQVPEKLTNGVPDAKEGNAVAELSTVDVVPEHPMNGVTNEVETGVQQPEKPKEEAVPQAAPPPPASVAATKEEEDDDDDDEEDLLGYTLECNGPCRSPVVSRWRPGTKFFCCMDCEDTDLCVDCHKTQTEYFTGGDGFWFKCCWAPHTFLEVPIAGWRGVKDGVIRIGDKEKPYVDWLEAVRNKWAKKMAGFEGAPVKS